jgi:hypothetical protein
MPARSNVITKKLCAQHGSTSLPRIGGKARAEQTGPQPATATPCLKSKETEMGHSLGDGIIVLALAFGFVAYFYFRHNERVRRLEVIHQERLAAMDKGIPLPELPIDPPRVPNPPDPRDILIHGLVWTAFGVGGMAALILMGPFENGMTLWPLPLPLALLGGGFILYYALVNKRSH